jgi:hypothetical protein
MHKLSDVCWGGNQTRALTTVRVFTRRCRASTRLQEGGTIGSDSVDRGKLEVRSSDQDHKLASQLIFLGSVARS